MPTPPPPSLSQNLGHGLATQDSALSQGCLLRHHQPWYHLPNPLPCPWPFCHWTWACSSVIGAVPAMEGWVGMEQGTWGKQGRAGRWWLVTLLSRLCGVLGKPWPWLLPPSRSSSILPSWDCSVGSTKVNTMPGLLARAVLQGETAPLKLLSCILGEPTLLVPSPPRPAPIPASTVNVGLRAGGEVKVEHSRHVVEVYAASHTCIWVRGPAGNTMTGSPPCSLSHVLMPIASTESPNKACVEPQDLRG